MPESDVMSIEKSYTPNLLPAHIRETGVTTTVSSDEHGHVARTCYRDPWFKENYQCVVTTPYIQNGNKKMIGGTIIRQVANEKGYFETETHHCMGKPILEATTYALSEEHTPTLLHEKILSADQFGRPVALEIAPVAELSHLSEQHTAALAYFLMEAKGIHMNPPSQPMAAIDQRNLLIEMAKLMLQQYGYTEEILPPLSGNQPASP